MIFSYIPLLTTASWLSALTSYVNADGYGCLNNNLDLSFDSSFIQQNNLGGIGYDDGEEEIRYEGVGIYNGQSLDLIVKVKEGATYEMGDYETNCYSDSGLSGRINLKAGRSTKLIFSFEVSGSPGTEVVIPGFYFSFLDIDQSKKVAETYEVAGWSGAWYDRERTQAYFSEDDPSKCADFEEPVGKCFFASSNHLGNRCDDPEDPLNLEIVDCDRSCGPVDQEKRAFTLAFEYRSSFEVHISADCLKKSCPNTGRDFYYSFESSLLGDCPRQAPTTAAPVVPQPTDIIWPTCGEGLEYGLVGEDCKCPINSPYRIFKKGSYKKPLTLEECKEECLNDPLCKYYSFGTDATRKKNYRGLCLGCAAEAEIKEQKGFDTFEVCEDRSGRLTETPTQTPTQLPPPVSYPDCDDGSSSLYGLIEEDSRCSFDSPNKLFKVGNRKNPFTLEKCQQKCLNHARCQYFSFGTDDAEKKNQRGMCVGCSAGAEFEDKDGFDSFEICQDKSSPAPIMEPTLPPDYRRECSDEDSPLYGFVQEDAKCPFDSPYKVFKLGSAKKPVSMAQCRKKCQNKKNCKYFTYATAGVANEDWRGVCVGCSAEAHFEDEIGFDAFEICDRTPNPTESPLTLDPTTTPTATPTVMPTISSSFAPVPCIPSTDDLNFIGSDLLENNLDGQGPLSDASEAIRYGNVGNINGRNIDLKVTLKENQQYQRISGNGFRCDDVDAKDTSCSTGSFGTINNKANMDTTFVFSFIDSVTNAAVTIPAFYFSVFDIDQQRNVREEYGITGFTSASYDTANQEAIFQEGASNSSFCQGQPASNGNCLFAKSKKIGKGCDNPVSPMDLGEFNCQNNIGNSMLRTFIVLFENKSQFELKFKTPCSKNCNNGRNFLFGFRSGLVSNCPTSEPTPSNNPTQEPRNGPTILPSAPPSTANPTKFPTVTPTMTPPTENPTKPPVPSPTKKPVSTNDKDCELAVDHVSLKTEGEVELRVDHAVGDPPSYLQITYKNGTHSGDSVNGWCVDVDRRIQNRQSYHADMYSSYDANVYHTGAVDRAENLPLVNWMINNIPNGATVDATKCGLGTAFELSWREYQRIIWKIVDFKDGSEYIRDNQVEECVVDMVYDMVIEQADTDFEPDCSDANAKIALLIVVDTDDGTIQKQVLIAEVLLSDTKGCKKICIDDKQEPTTAAPTTKAPKSQIKKCKSVGDPHLRSFYGIKFDNHDLGWHTLYEMGKVKIEAEHARIRPGRKNQMNNRAWRVSYDNQIIEQGEDGVIPSNDGKLTLVDPMVTVKITAHEARWSAHENRYYYNIHITTADYENASGLCTTAEAVNEFLEFPENPIVTVAVAEAACAALVGTDEYDDCVADLRLVDDIDAIDDIVGAAATAAAVEESLVEDFEAVRRFLRK